MFKLRSNRLNDLEQALAISKSFNETQIDLRNWFEELDGDLAKMNKPYKNIEKEAIVKELNFVKNIDRLLQEKKSDFDNLNKWSSLPCSRCIVP